MVVQAVGHHVIAAGRCADLESLLCNPSWLEHKLHAYGVACIVADFRRYHAVPSCPSCRLCPCGCCPNAPASLESAYAALWLPWLLFCWSLLPKPHFLNHCLYDHTDPT